MIAIDEAGHATEPEVIAVVAQLLEPTRPPGAGPDWRGGGGGGGGGGTHGNGQLVLAGDPQQLGPVIHADIAVELGFGVSLLERLCTESRTYRRRTHDERTAAMAKGPPSSQASRA